MATEDDKALRLEALKLAIDTAGDIRSVTVRAEEYFTFLVSDSKPEGIIIPPPKWVNGINAFRAAIEHFGGRGINIRQSENQDAWYADVNGIRIVLTGYELEQYDEEAITAILGAIVLQRKTL